MAKPKDEKKLPIVVKQKPEEPVAPEIIAKAIIDIAESARKALSAGLTREAIVTLIHAQGGVGKPDIRMVLNNLSDLRRHWCTR
jgi:hypothetical protein